MFANRAPCSYDATLETGLGEGRRFRVAPPMVQDCRDMPDPAQRRRVGHSKHEVVVLAALEADAQSADALEERPPIHSEMADHIVAEHQVGVPVGLEIGGRPPPTVVDKVGIRVDDVRVGVGLELDGDLIERLFGEHVVVIEQRDEFPSGEIEGGVGCGANMAVCFPRHDLDPRIERGKLPQDTPDMRPG